MKILITGGAGYLGSVLTSHLLTKGYTVTVVDNLLHNQTSLFPLCGNHKFSFVKGDVRDKALMKSLLENADVIIPLAAIVGAPACKKDPTMARSVNLQAIKMLDSLRSKNQRVIYPTTNSGYGMTAGLSSCTEKSPLKPISLYGKTKVEAEKVLLQSKNVISLRLATVFGVSPRMRIDLLVNNFVYEAVRRKYLVIYEKDFTRNYIHIQDVAECFVFCMENFNRMKNEAYNLGLNNANLTKVALAECIKKHIPDFYIHYSEVGTDPDKRNYLVSNDKIMNMGVKPKRTIDFGIEELIKAYRMLPRGQFANI